MPAPRRWFWFYRARGIFELQARQNVTNNRQSELIHTALDRFQIELPSWGFANTGTRFGKFLQPAAAGTTSEKFSDAGQVHRWTGVCPTVALHVLWDLPNGVGDVDEVAARWPPSTACAPAPSIPTCFRTRSTSTARSATPMPRFARRRSTTLLDSVEIGKRLGSRDLSLWFADGSNYPGTQNIRQRKHWFEEGLQATHARLDPRPAHAGGVQALRAGVLPHRHRRLGHGAAVSPEPPGRRPRCWWTPATTTRRRTSSRSWRGCSTWTCSAASTSTTAGTPTTI